VAEETAGLIPGPDPDLDPAERRLLAAMPLHAITSVHGQVGLRERLLMEIERFPAADRTRAQDALALAGRLHAADRRQRQPYANHLLRATIAGRGGPGRARRGPRQGRPAEDRAAEAGPAAAPAGPATRRT
jgi:hypothetical protein